MDNKDAQLLRAIAEIIIEEANKNAAFAKKLSDALHGGALALTPAPKPALEQPETAKPAVKGKRAANRRDPAVLNPIELANLGEQQLISKLNELDEKQLKDVIADYGMDQSKLAMKWRKKERLVNFIVERALARAAKGDAFRA